MDLLPYSAFVLAGLCQTVAPTASAPQDEGLELRIEAALAAFAADGGTDELALAIDLGGERLFERASGSDGPGPESALPATWVIEAALGFRLLDLDHTGRIDLDDSVLEHLPDLGWDAPGPTLRQLVGHTAGLPALQGPLGTTRPADDGEQEGPGPIEQWAAENPPQFEPGSCFEWSDGNLLVLSAALARALEMPFEQLIGELAAEPFGVEFEFAELGEVGRGGIEVGLPDGSSVSAGGLSELVAGPLALTLESGAELVRGLGSGTWLHESDARTIQHGVPVATGDRSPLAFGLGSTGLDASTGTILAGREGGQSVRLVHYLPEDLTLSLWSSAEIGDLERLERELARIVLDRPGAELADRPLSADELEGHAGRFQIGCDTLIVEVDGDHLALRGDVYEGARLLFQGAGVFAIEDDPDTRVTFELSDGVAIGFLLDVRGTSSRAVRVE